tara:strand:- start:3375 stop:4736 length:1362 start_codon:yes stop_codon:yes gene_type:complete
MKQLIDSQRDFFNSNKTKDVSFRIAQLKKLQHVIKVNENNFHEAIYKDFKKSKFENYSTEIIHVLLDIDEAIHKVKHWSRKRKVRTNLINFPAKSYVVSEPFGSTLIIGAWNFPYLTSLAPVVAAIAAGNTVILKPSEIASETSKLMAQVINNNFDSKYFALVEGGIPETTELLSFKFDKIFFTGSPTVGKIIYQAASEFLTPVTLELGGKSPVFVTESANLKMTAKRLVWAKFLNSGQACIAPDYVVVHSSNKKELLEMIKAEINKAKYSFENNNFVQIVDEKNMNRLVQLIDKSEVCVGGSYDIKQRYFEPTVLENVNFEDAVMQEEIFGPILPIIEFDNFEEVINKVKSLPKPLACYVFSEKKYEKEKVLNELSFGGGCVNDCNMQITNNNLPFGGVGDSGIGSYHGQFGFETFSHNKGVITKNTWFEPNLKYSPYSPFKLNLIKRLFGN